MKSLFALHETRIAFAVAIRDRTTRSPSAVAAIRGTMFRMDTLDTEIQVAAKKRARAEDAFKRADEDLRSLLVKGRAAGKGPSHMAKLTGFTREWVAKIAPDPKRTA